MRVPIGVFAMIYESRPNVTIEAASLAIKSGNACILRGGSEALQSNLALAALVRDALAEAGLPPDAVQLVATTDRAAVGHLIAAPESIDLVIPRGGKGLIERIAARGEGAGAQAPRRQLPRLRRRRRRPRRWRWRSSTTPRRRSCSPCNAAESLLVHAAVAAQFLPAIGAVFAKKGVEMRGDAAALRRCSRGVAGARLVAATEADWSEEYLARDHQHQGRRLARRGDRATSTATARTTPTRSSPTRTPAATRFLREVDSASVMVNASTRFADGFEYGLGAEIGISTDKLHARGPVGLEGLTSQKWIVLGQGELRGG